MNKLEEYSNWIGLSGDMYVKESDKFSIKPITRSLKHFYTHGKSKFVGLCNRTRRQEHGCRRSVEYSHFS